MSVNEYEHHDEMPVWVLENVYLNTLGTNSLRHTHMKYNSDFFKL